MTEKVFSPVRKQESQSRCDPFTTYISEKLTFGAANRNRRPVPVAAWTAPCSRKLLVDGPSQDARVLPARIDGRPGGSVGAAHGTAIQTVAIESTADRRVAPIHLIRNQEKLRCLAGCFRRH